jgi:hypothetical protein
MNRSFTLRPFWFALCLAFGLSSISIAQTSCEYTVILEDSFGDGWTGNTLTITTGGNALTFTLDNVNDNGFLAAFNFIVTDGDPIRVDFMAGTFINEVLVFDFRCGAQFDLRRWQYRHARYRLGFRDHRRLPFLPARHRQLSGSGEIRAFRADLSFRPSDPEGQTIIEYGTAGFMPGEGLGLTKTVSGAATTLFNLSENTDYEVYLSAACSNGDTSNIVGPYPFSTLYAVDVGVSAILSPNSGCNLGFVDSISLLITNYGGTPQTLIPFNFAVNGVPGGVNQPVDGVYTGVLGTDSTDLVKFDIGYDFEEPGEFLFEMWTDVMGDSVRSNDTTRLLIVNIPEIVDFPYFQSFERGTGGWTVEQAGNGLPTWEQGQPNGTIISSAANGSGAWVTNLTGLYNNNELSYLVSPCLDFSELEDDPRIAFSLILNTQACCDRLWVELSLDDGETWSKVGTAGTGINWYNDEFDQWWNGDGGFTGWQYVRNTLDGAAGASDARVRFVFASDGSVTREGVGIDNFFIGQPLARDMTASGLSNLADSLCGSLEDEVTLTIRNIGTSPQQNVPVAYSVNGGPIVMETTGQAIIFPDDELTYTFEQTFDSSVPGRYEIVAWSMLSNDGAPFNDTITTVYQTAFDLPYREDFESAALPSNWTVSSGVNVTNGHGNSSFVIHSNLWASTPTASMEGPVVGPVQAGDTLRFDYRMVNFSANGQGTVLTANDSLNVSISTDCGETYEQVLVINGNNHIPSAMLATVAIPLDEYVDEYIQFRFRGVWAVGDYWLDIDNINVRRCGDLALTAEVVNATGMNQADGSISVLPGDSEGPYTYVWSNGDSSRTITDLLPGEYTVTVADGFGCTDVLTVTVDITSSIAPAPDNIRSISIAPNPTTGLSTLQFEFNQRLDARIQVFNAMGQLLFDAQEQQISAGQYPIDLSAHSSGLYLVRVLAEGQVKTLKLIKQR